MINWKIVFLFLIWTLLSNNVLADCKKFKKSCLGAGCEKSIASYKQCMADEKKTKLKKEKDSLAGKRIIVRGSATSVLQDSAFSSVYFSFDYSYEMQFWTLFGEPVITCTVIWQPQDQQFYTFHEKGTSLSEDVPTTELAYAPKIIDMDLLIPLHQINGNFNHTNYVKCDAGALGSAGQKSFTSPGSPSWNKILVTNSGRLGTEGHSINLNYSYLPAHDAKAIVKSVMKISSGVVTDNGAQILKADFNVHAYLDWLRKKKTKKETKEVNKNEDEESFWAGDKKEKAKAIKDSASDDTFWSGEKEKIKAKSNSKSDEEFWSGDTKSNELFRSRLIKKCNSSFYTSWNSSINVCEKLSLKKELAANFGTKYKAGGAGVHTFDFSGQPKLGSTLKVRWEMHRVPDRLVVIYIKAGKETITLDTGMISGSSYKTLAPFSGESVRVILTGSRDGTSWDFTLSE